MKKSLVLLTAAMVLVLLFAGCKKEGGATGATTAGTKTPITFTYFNQDTGEDQPFDTPVAKKITELTGVTIKQDHPVAGDQQAIPLMVASGQYPDLVYSHGNDTPLKEAGALLRLDDPDNNLIAKRGKYVHIMFGNELGRLRDSEEDPYIYNLYAYPIREAMWSVDGAMQIQHAVLKDQGYPKITTLDDYEKAIKAYLAKYPTINGQKTIGFSLLIDTWQWFIDLSNPAGDIIGLPNDGEWYVDPNTQEAYYKRLHPGIEHYYRWLNRMNAEGVLDPESFTQKEDEWRAKIATGRVLGIAYPTWGYGEARSSLYAEGRDDRTYAPLPIVLNNSYTSAGLKNMGFTGGWGVNITTQCKDPERAFELLDWWCSEEAQILVNWGVEGVHYDVVNGKRVKKPEVRLAQQTDPEYGRKSGIGPWIYPFPQWGRGNLDSKGDYITPDTPDSIKEDYYPAEKETLAAYGVEMWTDLFPPTDSMPISKHGAAWLYTLPPDLNALTDEANDLSKTALANMVLGRPADFDAAWAKFQADLKAMGIEEANKAMTNLIRAKVALWSR